MDTKSIKVQLMKSYYWLLSNWQNITLQWEMSAGKNWLMRTVWIAVFLMYAVIVSSLFLAILPVILVSAVLLTLMIKFNRAKQTGPVTINVTPEAN